MFNIDTRLRARIAPHIERVLVVDPNLGATRVLTDLLKDIGARQRLHAPTTKRGLELTAEFQPQLIFVEFAGPDLDGVEFTTRLRRSTVAARTAPVIIITADTREASIKAARDSGAHEFLCKPFTAGHVFRRVENVTLKPRPWIEAKMYVGPDRRRFNSGQFEGAKKRRADAAMSTGAALAFASIKSQLDNIDADPQAALRAMMDQVVELQTATAAPAENAVAQAIAGLQKYLLGVMDRGGLDRKAVEQHLAAIVSSRARGGVAAKAPALSAEPALIA